MRVTINSASTDSVMVRFNRSSGANGWVKRGTGACFDAAGARPFSILLVSRQRLDGRVVHFLLGSSALVVGELGIALNMAVLSIFVLGSARSFSDIQADQSLAN